MEFSLPKTNQEIADSVIYIRDNEIESYNRIKKALYSRKLNLPPNKLDLYNSMYLFFEFCTEKNKH